MRSADVMLAERPNPTTRAHDQVLDANLAVRLQLFNYFAFTTERYSPRRSRRSAAPASSRPTF
jgi:hypothetical protein